jgi:hypothetical protein
MPGGSKICWELSRIRRGPRQRAYHQPNPGRRIAYLSGGKMPQPPLDPIACNGIPNRTADHKANTHSVIQMRSMDYQGGPTYTYATPGCLSEILSAAHSQRSGQHASRSTALSRIAGCGLYDAGPK